MLLWSTFGLLAAFSIAVPIGVALCIVGVAAIYFAGVPMSIVAQRMAFGLDNYSLVAVPLFLLMGNLMNATGITTRLGGATGATFHASLSADGGVVGFTSSASDLAAGDTNDLADVFVWVRRPVAG